MWEIFLCVVPSRWALSLSSLTIGVGWALSSYDCFVVMRAGGGSCVIVKRSMSWVYMHGRHSDCRISRLSTAVRAEFEKFCPWTGL